MKPAARISALIELLEQVEEGIASRGAPADVLVNKYFRERRYAGSKDRRTVSGLLYGILRKRESLLWVPSAEKPSARLMVIAYLALYEPESLSYFGEEGPYAPEELSENERTLIERINAEEAAANKRQNIPEWALAGFQARFGDEWSDAAEALNQTAPLDIRINPLKPGKNIRENINKLSEDIEKNRFSPVGFRSENNISLGNSALYKKGKIEVQDEAAQLASLLVAAKPGMKVVDLCAGAGGKSLLVSAMMENKGQLFAFDVSGKRLKECQKRAKRGGNRNIQVRKLASEGDNRSQALVDLRGKCDRVYVDVPCSGSGTWRRSPDQRWRQDAESLTSLSKTQLELLQEGAELTKQGGRLLYMTCSVLPAENEEVVNRFLENDGNWQLRNYRDIWVDVLSTPVPETCSSNGKMLQLAPHKHQTDGFFVAILERL